MSIVTQVRIVETPLAVTLTEMEDICSLFSSVIYYERCSGLEETCMLGVVIKELYDKYQIVYNG